MGEAKATDLVTTELPGPRRRQKERREREAELADLLVQIPQVRGLDVDRGPDLRGQGVGAKEPRLGGQTGVGRGVERMTVATGKESGPVGLARRQRIEEGLGAKEDIKAQLLLLGKRVVQVANRVRGYITSRMKLVNASISASGIWLSRPRSPGKATLNALNAKRSLKWPVLGCAEGPQGGARAIAAPVHGALVVHAA